MADSDLIPREEPGGMTWQEVKDFLDHIRTTCMDERQELKLEVRNLQRVVEKLQADLLEAVGALSILLEDTQHLHHPDCPDGPCPVREARDILRKYGVLND